MKRAFDTIAMDMDGTLLTSVERIIAPKTLDALRRVQKDGVRLVLISGRPIGSLLPYAEQLDMASHQGYLVGLNGGVLYSMEQQQVLSRTRMQKSALRAFFQEAEKYENARGVTLARLVYIGDQLYTDMPDHPAVLGLSERNHLCIQEVDSFLKDDPIMDEVDKCLLWAEPEEILKLLPHLQQALCDTVYVTASTPFLIEAMDPKVNKGEGLRQYVKQVEQSLERVLIFGDGDNDLPMLHLGAHFIAMGNAMPHIKKQAQQVTSSCDEEGIYEALLGLGMLEGCI